MLGVCLHALLFPLQVLPYCCVLPAYVAMKSASVEVVCIRYPFLSCGAVGDMAPCICQEAPASIGYDVLDLKLKNRCRKLKLHSDQDMSPAQGNNLTVMRCARQVEEAEMVVTAALALPRYRRGLILDGLATSAVCNTSQCQVLLAAMHAIAALGQRHEPACSSKTEPPKVYWICMDMDIDAAHARYTGPNDADLVPDTLQSISTDVVKRPLSADMAAKRQPGIPAVKSSKSGPKAKGGAALAHGGDPHRQGAILQEPPPPLDPFAKACFCLGTTHPHIPSCLRTRYARYLADDPELTGSLQLIHLAAAEGIGSHLIVRSIRVVVQDPQTLLRDICGTNFCLGLVATVLPGVPADAALIPSPYNLQILSRPRPRPALKADQRFFLGQARSIVQLEGNDTSFVSSPTAESGLPATRWKVPAKGAVALTICYHSKDPGQHSAHLHFEIVGVDNLVPLAMTGICAYPSISKDPQVLFSRHAKTSKLPGFERGYFGMERRYAFGPLLVFDRPIDDL